MLKNGFGAPWASSRARHDVPEKRGRDWENGLLNCLQDPFGANEGWDRPWSIADFKIEKKLHTAKASSVYSAKEASTGSPVIIKVYYKDKLSPLNKGQVDRERRIHGALRHPNIVRLFTTFEDDASIYLVMEQAAQGDLFMKMCAATKHFTERTIVGEFLYPLLLALDQMHTLGILHRDIKPENLLVCGDGTLKLADFGLAVDRREERPITRAGTLDYMAPEVLMCPDKTRPEQNKHLAELEYGTAVDVWAVGILVFELLVGRAPFARDTPRETYDSILSEEPAIPAHLAPQARAFLAATLAKDAHARPSVADLMQHPWVLQHLPEAAAAAAAAARAPQPGGGAVRLLNKSLSISDVGRYGLEGPRPVELVGEMSALSCDAMLGGRGGLSSSLTAAAALTPSSASCSAVHAMRVRPPAQGVPARGLGRSSSRRMLDAVHTSMVAQPSLLSSLQLPHGLAASQPLPSPDHSSSGRVGMQLDQLAVGGSSTMPRTAPAPRQLLQQQQQQQQALQQQQQQQQHAVQQLQQQQHHHQQVDRSAGFLAKIFSSPAKPAAAQPTVPRTSQFAAPSMAAPPPLSQQPSGSLLPPLLTPESSCRSLHRADTFESAISRWDSAGTGVVSSSMDMDGSAAIAASAAAVPAASARVRARLDDPDRSHRSLVSDLASAQSLSTLEEPLTPRGFAGTRLEALHRADPLPLHAGASELGLGGGGHAPAPPSAIVSPAAKLGGRARALLTRLSSRRLVVPQSEEGK